MKTAVQQHRAYIMQSHQSQQSHLSNRVVVRAILRLLLLLLCGCALAVGFMRAAKLHFEAIEHGYEEQNLRRERDKLVQEQRKLLLAREEASSPDRLERAARSLGMHPITSSQIVISKARKSH
ncbi:MAG: cell division protein FtsL [Pyrinomonadaceae bacterium]